MNEFGDIDPMITFDFNELNLDNESSQAMNFNSRVTALSALKDRNAISAEEMRQAVRNEDASHLSFLSDELPEPEEGDLETDSGSNDLLQSLFGGAQKETEQEQPQDAQEKPTGLFE